MNKLISTLFIVCFMTCAVLGQTTVTVDNPTLNSDVTSGNCVFNFNVTTTATTQPNDVVLLDNAGRSFSAGQSDGSVFQVVVTEAPNAAAYTFTLKIAGTDTQVNNMPTATCTQSPVQVSAIAADGESTQVATSGACTFNGVLTLEIPSGATVPTNTVLTIKSTAQPTLNSTIQAGQSVNATAETYAFTLTSPIAVISDLAVYASDVLVATISNSSTQTFTCNADAPTYTSLDVDSASHTTDATTGKCTFKYTVVYTLNGATPVDASTLTLTVDSGLTVSNFTEVTPAQGATTVSYTVTVVTGSGEFNKDDTFVLKQGDTILAGAGSDPAVTIAPITCTTATSAPTVTPTSTSSASSVTILSLLSVVLAVTITLF